MILRTPRLPEMKKPPLPEAVDVLIVGAGPHALAMASRLTLGNEAMADVIPPQESYVRRPKDVRSHLKKVRRSKIDRFMVVDESGKWMERWRNQFKALEISHLRSHEMMHPDAFDHSTLSVWAAANKRQSRFDDFLLLEKLPKSSAYHGPFVLPSSQLMLDFCRSLVKLGRLDDHLWHARAESMRPSAGGMAVTIRTPTGLKEIHAKRVVVARGPSWRRQWPSFYKNLDATAVSQIFHAWDLFDQPDKMKSLKGKGLIVGGGLTSAHLCAQLAQRGQVDLIIRRDRRVKQYDLSLYWMGAGRRDLRREYEQSTLEKKMEIHKNQRDGGSITPELNSVIEDLEAKGNVRVHEWAEVETASFDPSGSWTVALSSNEVLEADYLICATGALVDVASDPLLGSLQELHPLKLHGGLPVLTECLQWGNLPVHLMGNLAALELGPDAVNMAGATRGALRICKALDNVGMLDTRERAESTESTESSSDGVV